MYDVIVVGGRCAGSSLGMLLSRQGARVLVVDRATFPSEIPHGHFIHRHGPKRLQRWGVLDQIAATTPAITSGIFDAGDFPLRVDGLFEGGAAWAYGPRRSTLDHILLDAAVQAGAEVRPGFSVDEYVFEGGRVAGIRGHDRNGSQIEERASLVVGADGRRSGLARAVHAPTYNEVPPLLCYYFSYWSGVQSEPFELYVRSEQRRVVFSFKTDNDQFAVFVAFPMEEFAAVRRDIEGEVMRTLDLVGDIGHRVRAGRKEERYYGASDLPNFYRRPYGPGWALVGDAGLHKDPYMAMGICDALRDAELLSNAVMEGLGGARPMQEALADYEEARNQASKLNYEENLAAARFLPPPPQYFAIRSAVRHRPEQATRLIKASMGMIDPSSFFNHENLQQLLGAAVG